MGYLTTLRAIRAKCGPPVASPDPQDGGPLRTNVLTALTPPVTAPGQADDAPGGTIPPDWQAEVAGWPEPLRSEWRGMVTEYLGGLGRPAEADETGAAEHAAYCILRPQARP